MRMMAGQGGWKGQSGKSAGQLAAGWMGGQ